jgi:hypothetical protein
MNVVQPARFDGEVKLIAATMRARPRGKIVLGVDL